jgi:uncharacterized protein YutE (UPF0331/DUF86 family)
MVDPDLLRRKLAELGTLLAQISEFKDTTVEAYRSDWRTQRIVERTLQMAIESCLDIANHVVADSKLRIPSTYAETFDVLTEAGLLNPSMQLSMRRMVGFRNIVVHEYARVDADHVVRILHEHLGDLAAFEATAWDWIKD